MKFDINRCHVGVYVNAESVDTVTQIVEKIKSELPWLSDKLCIDVLPGPRENSSLRYVKIHLKGYSMPRYNFERLLSRPIKSHLRACGVDFHSKR